MEVKNLEINFKKIKCMSTDCQRYIWQVGNYTIYIKGVTMTLEKFEERLKLHNWNYQQASNAIVWNTSHMEYKKLIQFSFESPDHRRLFLTYKKLNGVI